MIQLTSIDFAKLIQYAAQKMFYQHLNSTQINKILFFVYGRYLALTGNKLFTDDTPKAWPYGPVFPIVNKRINPSEEVKFTPEMISEYKKNGTALEIIKDAVNVMHSKSAQMLTDWSHQIGSPWYRTLYEGRNDGSRAAWNTEIKDEYIKEYFT